MKQFDYIRTWDSLGIHNTRLWRSFTVQAPNESLLPNIEWFRYDYYTE